MLLKNNNYFFYIPEHHNNTIENVESITYVSKWTFRDYLEQHFHSKDGRKYNIAYLNHYSQLFWLSTDEQKKKNTIYSINIFNYETLINPLSYNIELHLLAILLLVIKFIICENKNVNV